MKYTGSLANPDIHAYYVTGSLEQKIENAPLQKMLSIIQRGGMNAFLNDKELGKFAKGLRSSFQADGYLSKDDFLTSLGEDIVKTGKSWRGLQGAFFITVLEYDGEAYLLDAELVSDKDAKNQSDGKTNIDFENQKDKLDFKDAVYIGAESEFRNIKPDAKWAYCRQQPKNSKVNFSFDYEKTECTISVAWQVGSKDRHCTFTTTEESHFAIVKQASAMDLLEDRENEENVFDFSVQDKTSIQIAVGDAEQVAGKKWISSFFDSGNFVFEGIQLDGAKGAGNIKDVRLYISQDDEKTTSILLKEYLLKKAEFSYLGYEETGRLVTAFQDLFTSPDGKMTACPPIMQETKEIYNELVKHAYSVSEKNPLAYLHLQAYIDLAPADTIKPYIEKEKTVNLTNQELSFTDLVEKVFGSERTIKSVCLLSKYTSTNGRNARAVKLFAETFATRFGIKPKLVTTKEEIRPNANKNFAESDRKWYERMKKSVHVVEKSVDDIKKIHDRYYKVVRTDGRTEWWVLTGELDSLRFENDNPRIREDVTVSETGKVKEMTFAQIRQSGIPENVVKLMEAL